ncbi:glycoside hydrolase family 130 protein [Sphingomonas abietis]|uniref:Glycoside hydrolase family 130 protein n=1 Tax=Sphingomonas abietis TaxID=3012344 RepID=A0ABY7NMH7_9SPHN|nr:glycoside hydrolase family 130 protein [Sphingomonas abietis]WBO21853.1 glycoside hydrolase family 130 protein [Sphingomonas abietis]
MSHASLFAHSRLHLRPDPSRTVIRPFSPEYPDAFRDEAHPRVRNIVEHVLALDERTLDRMYDRMVKSLADRHRDLEGIVQRRYEQIAQRLPICAQASDKGRLVIGAYFSEEYSFEAAALFNPSIVPHPEQDEEDGDTGGTIRFLMSLRGIGEGHISSVTFRTGRWSEASGFVMDDASGNAVSPRIEKVSDDGSTSIICEGSENVSETVLFPVTDSQRQGIEDLRLCRFVEEDGTVEYYGTYTAFDGRDARSELLHGTGFKSFDMRPLTGSAAAAKGMALFPRRIGGQYVMLGRQDNESIWLLRSDDLYHWDGGAKLISPQYPWEFAQMGNCGSPIEIAEGWLVLTHGVGMVRNYCMGAALLDRDDPSKVLKRTPEPILKPSARERDGYVPNVVYSCGSIVHGRTLLMPYGVADNFASFASCAIDDLLARME